MYIYTIPKIDFTIYFLFEIMSFTTISGLKDIDREIIRYVEDEELLQVWRINKKTYYETCDDNFLIRRIGKNTMTFKREDESVKQFFSRLVHFVSKMKEKHEFEYVEGNFEKQYEILERKYRANQLLDQAIEIGSLSLVKYAVQKGGQDYDEAVSLFHATGNGHLEIVKWSIESDFSRRCNPNICIRTINS